MVKEITTMNLLDCLINESAPQTNLSASLGLGGEVSILDALDLTDPQLIDVMSLFVPAGSLPSAAPSKSGLPNEAFAQLSAVSNEDYHADLSMVTRSKLELILRSPAHLKASLASPRGESPAMLIGTAFHAAVLEPTLFAEAFVAYCGGKTRASTEYKEFAQQHAGKAILSEKDYSKVIGMRDAVRSVVDFPLWDVLQLAEKEKVIEWTDADTGLRCKIRPDALTSAAIFDLKKTQDARAHKFMWSARDYGYDLQAAMYRIGVREALGLDLPFLFVAVEEEAPHGIQVFEAPSDMIEDGERRFRQAVRTYAKCLETDSWPCYPVSLVPLPWRSR